MITKISRRCFVNEGDVHIFDMRAAHEAGRFNPDPSGYTFEQLKALGFPDQFEVVFLAQTPVGVGVPNQGYIRAFRKDHYDQREKTVRPALIQLSVAEEFLREVVR